MLIWTTAGTRGAASLPPGTVARISTVCTTGMRGNPPLSRRPGSGRPRCSVWCGGAGLGALNLSWSSPAYVQDDVVRTDVGGIVEVGWRLTGPPLAKSRPTIRSHQAKACHTAPVPLPRGTGDRVAEPAASTWS